ncbi:MAG TPA: hypothetical protein VG891_03440 [Rhizomicrobium sp.]|nr:hypothetical protein [Rhizomicrobium sp.]
MTLTGLAFAGDYNPPPHGSDILNGQVDLNSQSTTLNTNIANVSGGVSGQAITGGNVLSVVTMQNSNVTNNQYVSNVKVSSTVNADIKNAGGGVSLTSQAICNSADISTDPMVTNVYSNQECNAKDPSAAMNANLTNIGGNVSLATTAISNTFSEDSNAPNAAVQNYQVNKAGTYATSNTNISNVGGDVNVSAAAIGNNAQIVHYSTGH